MSAQRRLRSACASAQSGQSLHCPHEEALNPWLSNEHQTKTYQTVQMHRLNWVFAGRTVWLCRFCRVIAKMPVICDSAMLSHAPSASRDIRSFHRSIALLALGISLLGKYVCTSSSWLYIMSPTEGEEDILFLLRIMLASVLASASASASASAWHFLACTISHEPVAGF